MLFIFKPSPTHAPLVTASKLATFSLTVWLLAKLESSLYWMTRKKRNDLTGLWLLAALASYGTLSWNLLLLWPASFKFYLTIKSDFKALCSLDILILWDNCIIKTACLSLINLLFNLYLWFILTICSPVVWDLSSRCSGLNFLKFLFWRLLFEPQK